MSQGQLGDRLRCCGECEQPWGAPVGHYEADACRALSPGGAASLFSRFSTVTCPLHECIVEPEAHLRRSGTVSWMFLHVVLVSSAVAFVLKSPKTGLTSEHEALRISKSVGVNRIFDCQHRHGVLGGESLL